MEGIIEIREKGELFQSAVIKIFGKEFELKLWKYGYITVTINDDNSEFGYKTIMDSEGYIYNSEGKKIGKIKNNADNIQEACKKVIKNFKKMYEFYKKKNKLYLLKF